MNARLSWQHVLFVLVCLSLPATTVSKADPTPTKQGRALLQEAQVKIWKTSAAATDKERENLLAEAKALLAKARKTFQPVHDQSKAAYDVFPKFIPQDDDDYENRREAELEYIRAQLDLAICSHAEAQTFAQGSNQAHDQLRTAAEEFRTIHEKYRSLVAGLYARMWQGKCLEEQNEIGKALGIYNELLAHPGQSGTMQTLQDQARHFRMICLNSDSRKDYKLVINEAEAWMTEKEKQAGTTVFLAIQFQNAKAHEMLADQIQAKHETAKAQAKQSQKPAPPEPAAEIKSHRQTALNNARQVAKYQTQDQTPAKAMIKRLKEKLGPQDPVGD